jgi:DNA polymerase-3 subunit epsilon
MLILCYDTETTGLVKGSDYTNPSNPYLASIAMILYDTEAQRVVASLNSAILPEGWSMPEDAGKVNGLTDEYLMAVGIPARTILPAIISLVFKADLLVAHNIEFDTKILAAAMWRQLQEEQEHETIAHELIKGWLSHPAYCTMKESKDIVQAKTANGRSKYPKLIEAYKHFFGKDLDRAHSANADAVAVLEIYMALQKEK